MHFGNSAVNFGGSAVRRPVGHDSAAGMSKLVALLPNYMQIVQNWSEKGVDRVFANPLEKNRYSAESLGSPRTPATLQRLRGSTEESREFANSRP